MAVALSVLLTLISLVAAALAVPIQLFVEWRENRGKDPRFHVFYCDHCRCFLEGAFSSLCCSHCGRYLRPLEV